ncbi:type I DNA topoisomerase [Limnoglobus roseus]|uniref:DNA topoisomerase 1 n=1 Tax=Limnoglobus roseus TaxID=2598579 RepID=A0A5C1AA63_9BACT|nr:type I DNA topoisomerase [Limnoglobus roseus]QEL16279.1 type I DNA topoisomerase [Limnoglobus roseus]
MPTPRKKPDAEKKTPAKKAPARKTTKKADAEAAAQIPTGVEPAAARRKRTAAASTDRSVPGATASSGGKGKYDLVIVESPAKAKTINKYLGNAYKVLASYGHVRDLATNKKGVKDEEVQGINISDGWKLRYVVDAGSKNKVRRGRRTQREILDELQAAAGKANRVLLASDPDREGEAIAWHIADELQLNPDNTYRITFQEITKSAIQTALANPEAINMDRVKAQEARRAMDRVVGFPLSNLLGDKVQYGLSAGRVQSVAVRLIVERELEIEAFKSEEYWKLTALLTPEGSGVTWKAVASKSKIFAKKKVEKPALAADAKPEDPNAPEKPDDDEEEKSGIPEAPEGAFTAELAKWNSAELALKSEADTDAVLKALEGQPFVITKVEQKDQQQKPRAPFTTSTMQQDANQRLRFTAKRTMDTAQRLYEGVELTGLGPTALITYMRTDSTRISADALNTVRGHIQQAFGDRYLPAKANFYASGKSAQEAHECVRPTDVAMTPQRAGSLGLAGDQLRLYTLIYNRFVACQMTPALFAITNVEITAGAGLFRTTGRILKFDGYMRVLPPGKREDTELPPLAEKQTLNRLDLFSTQHFTQPPPRFNDGSLVRMLEKEGIGRPSTYASIIQTIQDRGYVSQKDRRFYATGLGKVITKLLKDHFPKIMDYKFTSHFEEELDEIETRKFQYEDVLNEFWGSFTKELEAAKTAMPQHRGGIPTGEMCPKCGRPLEERISRKTKKPFVGCSGFADEANPCKYIVGVIEPEVTDIPCPKCGKFMLKRQGKSGFFLGCSGYPDCKTTMNFGPDGKPVLSSVETEYTCEKCGKPLAKREGSRGPFLGCTGYPKCKNIVDIGPDGKPAKPIETGVTCDKCQSPMTIKRGPRGPFLACTAYPKCRNAKPLSAELKEQLKDVLPPPPVKKPMPNVEITEACPECEGPMKLQKSRFGGGKFFLSCAKYPKCKGTKKVTPELELKIQEAEAAAASAPVEATA